MKQFLFLLLSIPILLSKSVNAQIDLGIKTGLTLSKVAVTNDDFNPDVSNVIGIPIGISADIKLYKNLFLQPSVYLSRKGFKSDDLGFGDDFKANVTYLEFPLIFLYKHNIGLNNLVVGLGSYLGYGLDGKWTTPQEAVIGDIIIGKEGDINFQNDAIINSYGDYVYGKPYDYGANALVGFEVLKRYLIQINTSYGLRNINSNWGDFIPKEKKYNRTFGLTFGYLF
jgi:hypothetical protein